MLVVQGFDEKELVQMASCAEEYSNHPIAKSILEYYKAKYPNENKEAYRISAADIREVSGQGLIATYNGKELLVGNEKLLKDIGTKIVDDTTSGTVVYVAYDKKIAGAVIISDVIKDGSSEAIKSLKKAGVKKTVMLTGDSRKVASFVSKEVGIDETVAELLPEGKVTAVEKLLTKHDNRNSLAFVGDGINDAPVLMRADVGIAMGSLGSDAAIEAADIVIMDDDLRKISSVINIARKTVRIVKENIVFALSVKIIILILGALGLTTMWLAVFGDVGVAVIAILNSMRALNYK